MEIDRFKSVNIPLYLDLGKDRKLEDFLSYIRIAVNETGIQEPVVWLAGGYESDPYLQVQGKKEKTDLEIQKELERIRKRAKAEAEEREARELKERQLYQKLKEKYG